MVEWRAGCADADEHQDVPRTELLRFFESARGDQLLEQVVWEFVMVVRISFGVLIATSLALTIYFGATAWRLSGDMQSDNGWTARLRMMNPP